MKEKIKNPWDKVKVDKKTNKLKGMLTDELAANAMIYVSGFNLTQSGMPITHLPKTNRR